MKPCFKCGRARPLTEFYKHPAMKDGRLNKCKDCTKRDVRENRQRRHDQYLAYDRERSKLPHRRAALKAYRDRDAHKERARIAVSNAIRDGRLTPAPCVICGDATADAHHEDYDRPLDVTWLCRAHHAQRHAELAGKTNYQVWRAIGAPRPVAAPREVL
jgi:hypothetical protein